MPLIDYADLIGEQRALIKHFHKRHQLAAPAQTDKLALLSQQQRLIAVARFVEINQAWWLRGLFVVESQRGQGLGTQLLRASLCQLNAPCYAFAQPHLNHFYRHLGFQARDTFTLQTELASRFQRYQQHKPDLQIWYYEQRDESTL